MESKKIKLKDIAEYTGVSVSTVSRVLNNRDRVKNEVRKKVWNAVKKFNYVPNEVARSLKRQTTNAIGVIINDVTNMFFSKIVKGIENYAYEKGYYTIVCNSDSEIEREIRYSNMLLKLNVCGLIVDTRCKTPELEKIYANSGIPIVYIDNIPPWETECSTVAINNYLYSKKLVRDLILKGHKRIAIINEDCNSGSVAIDRLKGWKDALLEAGLEINPKYQLEATYKNANIDNCMGMLLANKEMPTAVFATNNIIAYGIVSFALRNGLKIPNDLSLVCFDAEDDYGIIHPKLTGVIQPAMEMGQVAAQIIINMNDQNSSKVSEKVILKVTEVEGETVIRLTEK